MPSSLLDIDSSSNSTESSNTGYQNSLCIEVEQNSSEQSLISNSELNALNPVIKFYLDGDGQSSLVQEFFKQTGLLVIAIGGVLFYYVPSLAYAESICADPNYQAIPCDFFKVNHVAGTMLVAGGVLMSATNSFFDRQLAESIPTKLERYLQHSLTPAQKIAENVVTYAGSFVASMPFMIITVFNPIPGLPKLAIISQAFMVGVTNTLLHLLPFKLALQNPLYRLPFLPFEYVIKAITAARLSEKQKQEKSLQASINRSIQEIKQRVIRPLDMAQKVLSIYGFKFSGCHYTNEVADIIQENQAGDQLPVQLLTQLLDCLQALSPNQPIPPPGVLNKFLKKMIYIPGASWVILACAGFWGSTYHEISDLTGDRVLGGLVSAPSIYCLGVLLAFFGGNALQNSYDYLTAWRDDAVKIPMSFKLYPKTSVLLILISLYLSAFSYSAGAQLINDNFKCELEFLRPYLLKLSKTGLIFLGFTAIVEFFSEVLKKFAQYGGAEDVKTVAKLYASLNQMKDGIQLMKPELLLESLADIKEGQLKIILGIKDNNDLEDLNVFLMHFAEQLKLKVLKTMECVSHENSNELFSKLCKELKKDFCYKVSTIDVLLAYLNEKPELVVQLALSWKQACQEYKSICKIIESLDKLRLSFITERPMITFSRHSINDDSIAGSSSEITPLIFPRRAASFANFYHPHYGDDEVKTSLSAMPVNANQMRI